MRSNLLFLLCLIIAILLPSCNNKAQLTESLKHEVQLKLNEAGAKDITVEDVILVNVNGNKYQGVVRIKETDGIHDYDIDVISDGESYKWEMPTTPIQRQALKKLQNGLDQVQQEIYKSLNELQSELEDHSSTEDYNNY